MSKAGMPSGPSRLAIASWLVYDLANTIFALGVVGVYFSAWMVAEGHPDSYLAIVHATGAAAVVFLAPWVGALTDATGRRVPMLIVTTVAAVVATALLAIGPVWLTFLMLWIGVVGVHTGSVVYDALLVDVSTETNRGRISGMGVGVSYFGSFIGLGLGVLAIDVLDWGYPGAFRLIAAAFLVFALPSFLFIRERPVIVAAPLPSLRRIASRLIASWRAARTYEGIVPFLIGRFFYTDAINTLVGGFLAIFVIDELGLEESFFVALMVVTIVGAIVGGFGSGPLIEKHGPLRVLRFVLVMWMLAIAAGVTAAVTGLTDLAWVIGPMGGIALGATWASDRVVMLRLSPPRRLGEFYGLYATVARFATIVGPLAWALIVDVIGLSRSFAMGTLAAFIAIGWIILAGIDDRIRQWKPEDLLVKPGRSPGGGFEGGRPPSQFQ